jgi:uncharacterized protein
MGKILLLIVLVAVAMAWFRNRARREAAEELAENQAREQARGPRQVAPERMVSCAQCGLNLPASEAVFDAGGTAFCGAPHLEAARMRRRA